MRIPLLAALLAGCGPAPSEELPASAEAAVVERAVLHVADVHLLLPNVPEGRWGQERAGLVSALIELGLADIEGVVPRIAGLAPSPGLRQVVTADAERWEASVSVSLDPWEVGLTVCEQDGPCELHRSEAGSPTEPSPAVAEVLDQTAAQLLRRPDPEARETWAAPVSDDPYATLLAGRGAAAFYGLGPVVKQTAVGDAKRDPITRAVRVDPGMAVASWLLARREYDRDLPFAARGLVVRGFLSRPSPVFSADEGACFALEDKASSARRVWDGLSARAPSDLRFLAPTASARLAAGALDETASLLADWPDAVLRHPAIAELRVALAEARGELDGYDDLLAIWQAADPTDPEPVRRRVQIRVRAEAYDEALPLTDELARRGAEAESRDLATALLAALGRWSEAAASAETAGKSTLAARLRARGALEKDATTLPPELAEDRTEAGLVARGWVALAQGDGKSALTAADRALAVRGTSVPALRLRAEAAELAQSPTADKAVEALDRAWPQGSYSSPRTAAGSSGSAPQPHAP
ncbi:MAG: hypothetical protein EP330_07910 [Deltaproteobacteria bacterium]|nr:MAG: hypothetical protein EP330_07910 [Deltaproteobacteria bacterium]